MHVQQRLPHPWRPPQNGTAVKLILQITQHNDMEPASAYHNIFVVSDASH